MTACTCKTCSCSEQEIAAFHAATAPIKQKVTSYELEHIQSRQFYGDELQDVLSAACDWVNETGGTPLVLRPAYSEDGSWSLSAFVETF